MKTYEFDALIRKHEEQDAAYIEFPYSVEEEFGTKGQVKVQATFDGHPYRGSLAKMGLPCHCLGIRKDIRKVIGKEAGEVVHVMIRHDLEERSVQVPGDLEDLLFSNPAAKVNFGKLSYSHKKKYVDWINDAKKEETRLNRMTQAIVLLTDNKKL